MPRTATTAKWPAALLTVPDVGLFTNREDADLIAAATNTDTTLQVDDASGFAIGMWLATSSQDGFEIVQVSAVDLGLNTVTVTRGKDGTTPIAHNAAQTIKAVPVAAGLNQLRDDLIAVESFLGITGSTITWNRALVLEYTGNSPVMTLGMTSGNTSQKFISFQRSTDAGATWPELGYINYDAATSELELTNLTLTVGPGSNFLVEDNRVIKYGTSANATMGYVTANTRVEYASDVDLRFRAVTGSTELLSITTAAIVANKTVQPRTTGSIDLGTRSLLWRDVYIGASSLHVINTAGDANDLYRLGTAGLSAGAGGASTLDSFLARRASSDWIATGALAGDVRFGMTGAATPRLSLRLATADTNHVAAILTDRVEFGAGGLSAVDVNFVRTGANTATITASGGLTLAGSLLPDADATRSIGSSALRYSNAIANAHTVYNAASDANPVALLNASGLAFGAGGATATDVLMSRQASSTVHFTGTLAGGVRIGMSGANTPIVALRLISGDANPAAQLLQDRVSFGAGGATAVDTELVRTGANAATLSATLSPATDNARDLGTASLRWRSLYLTPTSLHVLAAAGDANDVLTIGNASISYGQGGATATDTTVARQASTALQLTGAFTGSVRWGMTANTTPFLALRAAAADTNPVAQLLSASLSFGVGGATATDTFLWRQASNVIAAGSTGALIDGTFYASTLKVKNAGAGADPTITSNSGAANITFSGGLTINSGLNAGADNSYSIGSATNRFQTVFGNNFSVFGTSGDANPVLKASSAGIAYGPGGATATDVLEARKASSVLEVTGALAGSVRYGMSGAATPFLALRAAAADTNELVSLTTTGLNIGAGGASAVDVTLLRTGAAAATFTGQLTFATGITMGSGINIATNTGTGTIIAATASQKLAFFGAAAIVQPTQTLSAITDSTGGAASTTFAAITAGAAYAQADMVAVKNALAEIALLFNAYRTTIRSLGLNS